MKPSHAVPRGKEIDQRMRIAPIPMEWMHPGSWRLPSGKALAEFALQAGFLAPLLLGEGSAKRWSIDRKAANPVARRAATVRESR